MDLVTTLDSLIDELNDLKLTGTRLVRTAALVERLETLSANVKMLADEQPAA